MTGIRFPRQLLLATILLLPDQAAAVVDPVKSELVQSECWAGEPVTLLITLYSPGPFSGTARFELPELPQTAILSAGGPLIGSEEIDGDTWFTQRHEFRIFTQRSGTITIPGFRVSFSGKPSFTADPEQVESATEALSFESRRPPGARPDEIVVAVQDMTLQQTWRPQPPRNLMAGDVIIRTITRTAQNTTAMMLPPPVTDSTATIRVYPAAPELNDLTERGSFAASRVDTVRYQFQSAGKHRIPDLTFTWWDVSNASLRSATLEGQEYDILPAARMSSEQGDGTDSRAATWILLLLAGSAIGVTSFLLRHRLRTFLIAARPPEHRAAERLQRACDRNETELAYRALLDWKRIVQTLPDGDTIAQSESWQEFATAEGELSRKLFQKDAVPSTWSGRRLKAAFLALRAEASERRRQTRGVPSLPPLNP